MLRVQILLVYEYAVIKFPALIYVIVNWCFLEVIFLTPVFFFLYKLEWQSVLQDSHIKLSLDFMSCLWLIVEIQEIISLTTTCFSHYSIFHLRSSFIGFNLWRLCFDSKSCQDNVFFPQLFLHKSLGVISCLCQLAMLQHICIWTRLWLFH